MEHTRINDHTINLIKGQQPSYKLIYNLGPIKLETLKIYIKSNLANSFIIPFKSPASALILFVKKLDRSLWLYVKYRDLNNLIIKNQYYCHLIRESIYWLNCAKHFTHLDLTSAYHRMYIQERDKWKTVLRNWYSYFEYQVILFILSNALASFKGYINKILAELHNVFIIVDLDSILIYINKVKYINSIWWVFE